MFSAHLLNLEVFSQNQNRCTIDRLDLEQRECSLTDLRQFFLESRPLQVRWSRLSPAHQEEQAPRNVNTFGIASIRLVSVHSINDVRGPHFVHNEIINAGVRFAIGPCLPGACQLDNLLPAESKQTASIVASAKKSQLLISIPCLANPSAPSAGADSSMRAAAACSKIRCCEPPIELRRRLVASCHKAGKYGTVKLVLQVQGICFFGEGAT